MIAWLLEGNHAMWLVLGAAAALTGIGLAWWRGLGGPPKRAMVGFMLGGPLVAGLFFLHQLLVQVVGFDRVATVVAVLVTSVVAWASLGWWVSGEERI